MEKALTFAEAVALHQGLAALDKDVFKTANDKVPIRIGINFNRLEGVVKLFNKRRQQIQKELFGHLGDVKRDHPNLGDFNDRITALQETMTDPIKLYTFKVSELNVKDNDIGGVTLGRLAPILEDLDTAGE